MFRLSRKVEFSLMILKHFSGRKKLRALGLNDHSDQNLSSAVTIARRYRISFPLTQKMLQKLKQKNILTSIQGMKGGYQLARDLREISFLELMEAVEGPVNAVRCVNNKSSSCTYFEGCEIIDPMRNFNLKLRDFYANINLDELMNFSFRKYFLNKNERE